MKLFNLFNKIKSLIVKRWNGEGGYWAVLVVAFPLILSSGMWTLQHFVDRMFLTWYSPEAIAASMPAGMINFTVLSLFLGTASFTSTFIAQYHGSDQHNKIGSILWHGLFLAVGGGMINMTLIPFAESLFSFIGHDPLVQQNEVIYLRILCLGSIPVIASSAISGFFSGRGKTWPVLWVNVLATIINLIMDYILIFGKFGFPEMGIAGAAIATVVSGWVALIAYIILILRPQYIKFYNILNSWRFDLTIFSRLMKFGFPSGVQFFLDMIGISIFILLIGRIGMNQLAATNITFNITTLTFMPMFGFGMAVSILVGQSLGNEKPESAKQSVYSGFHMTFLYMLGFAVAYWTVPELFLRPFAFQADPSRFEQIKEITIILLRFAAIYTVFDTMNIIFSSAIKGAGDTRFVMIIIFFVSLLGLVVPGFVVLVLFEADIYAAWIILSAYVILLGFIFWIRFQGGKWKDMLVIEKPSLPTGL